MRPLILFLAIGALAAGPVAADEDPVFDVAALAGTPLNARVLKSTEEDGIVTEEVMFHSEMDGEKSVDIFAFLCYPKGAKGLPAFIWNQSGCAQASTWFPLLGARRGYAAMCIDFPIPGYRSTGDYNIASGLQLTEDIHDAPIYHGAVALLKAVSYLQSRPEVDADRIGMCGSSWGGFFTTLMIGLDGRLKAGSAMFGCGGLHLGNSWWDAGGRSDQFDDAYRERWAATLDPALRLATSRTPMAWFSGTNDNFYWMPGLMASYRAAAGPKHLSLLPNWDHGLTPALDEQVFAWLDVHLKGEKPFNEVSPVKVAAEDGVLIARWTCTGPRPVAAGEINLSFGAEGNWKSRFWRTLEARRDGEGFAVRLPPTAMPYVVSATCTDEQGFRYSTAIALVEPTSFGLADAGMPLPSYDGCAMWGGFEKQHVLYGVALGFMNVTASDDAREGEQSAALKPGANRLFPIYYVPEVPHRFSCYLKADATTKITVELVGAYGGRQETARAEAEAGTEWTEITVDCTPRQAAYGTLSAVVTVPEGRRVLADSVTLRPVAREKD